MELVIGHTVIPYVVRESAQLRSKRVVVVPGRVEVVVPVGTPMAGVLAFVHHKRRWIFDNVRAVEDQHRALLAQSFASGAKLQYRGRELMMEVGEGEVGEVVITCRSKFHVLVPVGLEGVGRLEAIQSAFERWLRARAMDAVMLFAPLHEASLGVVAGGWRLSDARSKWGSCGKDRVIRIHWQLIQAPPSAMEYVVAHELVHLLQRNHGPKFWQLLSKTLPDWADRKAQLEQWEVDRRRFGE